MDERRATGDRRQSSHIGRRSTDPASDDSKASRQLLEVQGDIEQLKSVVQILTDAVQVLTAACPVP